MRCVYMCPKCGRYEYHESSDVSRHMCRCGEMFTRFPNYDDSVKSDDEEQAYLDSLWAQLSASKPSCGNGAKSPAQRAAGGLSSLLKISAIVVFALCVLLFFLFLSVSFIVCVFILLFGAVSGLLLLAAGDMVQTLHSIKAGAYKPDDAKTDETAASSEADK